ncbi:hypothetical protein GOODEAATRI_017500, partial [Goodea atripinnis]
ETAAVPFFGIPFIVQMLLLVSPLLGFSIIAQHAIAQYLVTVTVTFCCCFSALKIPVIATQLAVVSSSLPCVACWSSRDSLSACSWLYPVPPFFVLFVGLQKVRCQPAASPRHS